MARCVSAEGRAPEANGLPIEVVDVDPGDDHDVGYEDDHIVYMDISKAIQNTAVFSVLWRSWQL